MLNIVTAYLREAAPFIAHFDLLCAQHNESGHKSGQVYTAAGIRLGVSGAGAANCQRLVTRMLRHHHRTEPPDCWINFGIGGGTYPIGTLVGALTVKNVATGAVWQLATPNASALPVHATLHTLAAASCDYRDAVMFDLEAAGMVAALAAVAPTRQYVVKLITDNPTAPVHQLRRATIHHLLQTHTDAIIAALTALYSDANQSSPTL